MSETLCTLRTKGGGSGRYTETSLWTNSAPTSSFTGQTVTLSESMDNFKYLKIKYAFSTSLYADANCNEIEIPVADFKKSLSASTGNALIVVGGSSSTTRYTRFVFYSSNTGVQFGHSVQFQTSTINDNTCIPLEILGLNELDHGKNFDETVLWTNASPTSSFASQQITLSDDMTNYDYLKITYRANTSLATTASALMLVNEIIASANLPSVPCMSIADRNSGANGYYMRGMDYVSTTVISIGTCFQTGTSGNVNSSVIPLQISGCKFR